MTSSIVSAADILIPPAAYAPPRGYVCFRASERPIVDGKLDEPSWAAAAWTEDFGDIEGDKKPKPRFRTRAKMIWTDEGLYVGAEMEEPHVWGTITKHDSVIFHENDFEVFFDPDGDSHNYGEFEMNAINGTWDLRLNKPYKDGGKADDGWEIPGVQSAVHVRGTLNDPSDTDEGWSLEIFFPFNLRHILSKPDFPVREALRDGSIFREYGQPFAPTRTGWVPVEPTQDFGLNSEYESLVRQLTTPKPMPNYVPFDGGQWRINFSRVEWHVDVVDGKYLRTPNKPEDNWVWSPQAKIDMHRPETWGYLQFSKVAVTDPASRQVAFRSDETGPARHLVSRVYYAQQAYHQAHKRYAKTLDELKLDGLDHPWLTAPVGIHTVGSNQFTATARIVLSTGEKRRVVIQSDARIMSLPD